MIIMCFFGLTMEGLFVIFGMVGIPSNIGVFFVFRTGLLPQGCIRGELFKLNCYSSNMGRKALSCIWNVSEGSFGNGWTVEPLVLCFTRRFRFHNFHISFTGEEASGWKTHENTIQFISTYRLLKIAELLQVVEYLFFFLRLASL